MPKQKPARQMTALTKRPRNRQKTLAMQEPPDKVNRPQQVILRDVFFQ
jgi:hypothetical protein